MTRIASLCVAVYFSLVSFVRAESVGYVDSNRVRVTATQPKRADAEYQASQPLRDKALNDAVAVIKAAKAAEQAAALASAREVQAANQAVAKKVDDDFNKGLAEILAKLHADRHVAIAAGPGIILVPGADLTDEVIRRWDALDAKGMADELARTKAENERLRAAARPEPPKK